MSKRKQDSVKYGDFEPAFGGYSNADIEASIKEEKAMDAQIKRYIDYPEYLVTYHYDTVNHYDNNRLYITCDESYKWNGLNYDKIMVFRQVDNWKMDL